MGKLVSFDVNYRNLMWDDDRAAAAAAVLRVLPDIDLLKISDEEADMLGGEEAIPDLMRENGVSVVIETLGSRGARCYWNGKILRIDGLKADCVDTCGAGDAFWGGFLSTLLLAGVRTPDALTEALLLQAMRRGNIAGWLCVQKKGAIESLPTAQEVERYGKELYGQ